ncbi:MAG: hypothetical protein CO148_01140 [Nitrospirae bacterium CG_4_9_14_3_um_filter_41_27]|nr:MAG: hypothetical protein COS27_10495 [Nitrospirae bacterium CG02_land_8_20_14_3_00_41_53]PIW88097.1 MAG: hypothetical protein COZ94_01595 [Nitrospirae bacterium CG_4_8_14_3_um_filter_41_47]PJA80939.1 MAG: hypothetical protein CO148_01140 [Nitrospirae bacterium CG_4_9_14_3_um_filter_41_27]
MLSGRYIFIWEYMQMETILCSYNYKLKHIENYGGKFFDQSGNHLIYRVEEYVADCPDWSAKTDTE